MISNITLQEYADIKKSTIEAIVNYASGKGISIPMDGNYILDDFTLKQIDPILHHQRKFKRPIKSKLQATENIPISEYAITSYNHFEDSIDKRFIGTIDKVLNHGAFISVDGHVGFLNLSDLDWGYINNIHAILKEDSQIEVILLERDRNKIKWGRKQLLPDPLIEFSNKVERGLVVEGVVRKVSRKGIAYIEISDKICGECQLEDVSIVREGCIVHCAVDRIDCDNHILTLQLIEIISTPDAISSNPPKKNKEPNNAKRIIGIVKFYDRIKEFGFAVSSSKGISGKPEDLNKIFEFYIGSSEWESSSSPFEKALIVFTPTKTKRGWVATNAAPLSYDQEGLLIAMGYRGVYSVISGTDSKGDKHNKNILCHVIDSVKKKFNNDGQLVLNTFAEYLSSWDETKRANIIEQFLQDVNLCKQLVSLLPLLKTYNSEIQLHNEIIKCLCDSVEKSIFNKLDIDLFSALPIDFDFVSCIDRTYEVLISSAKNKPEQVKKWLAAHSELTSSLLELSKTHPFELLYTIYEVTKDLSIFEHTNEPWYATVNAIKEKSLPIAEEYFLCLLAKVGQNPTVISEIEKELEQTFFNNVVRLMLKENTKFHYVLNAIIGLCVNSDLTLISEFIKLGIEIRPAYNKLSSVLSQKAKEEEASVRDFFLICNEAKISIEDIFLQAEKIADEMLVELFIQTANEEYLNQIEDIDLVPLWLNRQDKVCLLGFLIQCQKAFSTEEDIEALTEIVSTIDKDLLYESIKDLVVDEQYKLLQLFPDDQVKNFIVQHFSSSPLYDMYIGEEWEKLKAEIPYVVFDLESDGETISEFAFKTENNTKTYQSDEQLNSLLRALKRTDIIVGHRVKEWDLGKILSKRGFKSNAFVWDTLEIEILLNPCRYSYALRTGHTAEEDTELTDKLFWNQLYRLSKDSSLCDELKDLLPPQLNSIIEKLQAPVFSDFFRNSSSGEVTFYQELVDTDERVIKSLNQIDLNADDASSLIIAPTRLWPRIANYVNLSFMQTQNGIDYLALDTELLKKKPLEDIFINTIIKRFIKLSKTPIVANIAQYIRANYLTDELLLDYVKPAEGTVCCGDLSIIEHNDIIKSYKKIYFVGCEIENRINQYSLPTLLNPADFWNEKSSIPMRLGASSYIALSPDERKMSIFKDIPETAANVWIERSLKGQYRVNYNYDFYKRLSEIEEGRGDDILVETITWSIKSDDYRSIHLVHSKRGGGFEATMKRVSATSRYRATYWTYQFALLNKIHNEKDRKPIILFLEDLVEKDKVEQYARACGYYIPENGSLIRKLELIEHNPNGLLIVGNEQFFDIIDWRKDTPFSYVWDHLAVEKHMMMWHGFTNEANRSFLEDEIVEKGVELSIGSSKDTYQSALISLWPVYEYYFRFIRANSVESSMYVLDSFMEEYHTLSSIWETSSFGARNLWEKEEKFLTDLSETRKYFNDSTSIYQDETAIETAMDIILNTLIKSEKKPNPEWSDIQKEILPLILKRNENFLVSLPTGGGKSVLFQGPALYNAAYSNKLSIVVTPLKALMQDQVKELGEKGFITNVDYLNGDRSHEEVKSIYRKINGGEIAILYVSPERFRSRAFINALTTRMSNDNGLEYMVFDEAHCISQWGMEFRPEYLNVIKKCQELSSVYRKNMCIAMFSATVTDMIYNQINEVVPVKRLGQDNDKKIYNPIRSHIGMEFKEVTHDVRQRIKEITEYIQQHNIDPRKSRMLIFCKTREQCEETSLLLTDNLSKVGIINELNSTEYIGSFHAGMDGDDREDAYNRFKDDDDPLYILCATKAFGMGMDIPNIHYIVHYSPPSVMEDYLQEVGRAGRNEKMYKAVGFNAERPIPTVCLCSKEDIKKAKDQLLQNTLSWKNIEEIRSTILKYITKVQSIEKTMEYPIVIPNTLWASSQFDKDFTDFKIGMYWLERMKRIKMGYLSPAYINIKITNDDANKIKTLSNTIKGKYVANVISEISTIKKNCSEETVQVSVQGIASQLSIHASKILDTLILCSKHGFLEIEEETRCRIAFTRLSEVSYMLKNSYEKMALHVILKTTMQLLENSEVCLEKSYSLSDIKRIMQENDTLNRLVKQVTKTDDKGNTLTKKYMCWYDEDDKQKNKGLSLADSYHKDLYQKRIRQVFALLELVPDVKVHSYLDTTKKKVLQSVTVSSDTWYDYLTSFQNDCIKVISYLSNRDSPIIQWSKVIIELGLDTKGFGYFENILRFLNGMGYVATDPLMPTGIEVYTTKDSETPIIENPNEYSEDFQDKKDFDEAIDIRDLRLCIMDVLTKKIKSKQNFQDLISAYFSKTDASGLMELLGNYYDDSDPIWDAIRKTAIKNAEEQLKDNPEQWAIYSEDSNTNINVEAGPGSGKTHLLTLKCAKLIYHQHVNPRNILVLAYNRAVVVELKRRLAKIFGSLGLSRSASQLHIYTFHGLAKRICGTKALEGHDMKDWESILLETIKHNPSEVRAVMPDLQYIFIDEFQDITQIRLNAMFAFKGLFNPLTFFTIGDKDQSIYGFEKIESMDPNYYYDQLYSELKPKKMTMSTNYRSYPKILQAAALYLPETSKIPVPCKLNKENEPCDNYVSIYNNQRSWSKDFKEYIQKLQQININDVAVFFRTNNEVYHGYSEIKTLNIPGIRIRIQGAAACELFRIREIYAVLKLLDEMGTKPLRLEYGESEKQLRDSISPWIKRFPNWDTFYMDFAFVLVLDYLDFAASDEEAHTYADMAESIRETLKEDNPQLYKLYDDKRFAERRICREKQLDVVLTTMHKVKGLEFDAVIITPSFVSLPFNSNENITLDEPISDLDNQQIEEEQRLLYVAYTRARKHLIVYKGEREHAVKNKMRFACCDNQWGIREKEIKLANYNIGFNAGYNFYSNKTIVYKIKKNDPVIVRKERKTSRSGSPFITYNIIHEGDTVGQFSRKSAIAYQMETENIDMLSGFFVSDVFYWTYQDTLDADTKNGTDYANKWCKEAMDQGYIFIVNIAGYGIK